MLKNYFKIAWRNLWKRKVLAFINIGGLTVGLTIGLLALLWVQDELSFDRFHDSGDRIFLTVTHVGSGTDEQAWITSPGGLAPAALPKVPEIEAAVRITDNEDMSLFAYQDKRFIEKEIAYVDPSFFSVFDFPLVQGDGEKPFKNNKSIVISESVARKYFGQEDPVGKLLEVDQEQYFEVTGVIGDIPENSSIQYTIFCPFDILVQQGAEEHWDNFNYLTYFQLHKQADLKKAATNISDIIYELSPPAPGERREPLVSLQPLHDIHLYNPDGTEAGISTVRVFMLVAVIILLVACINYVNITTAGASVRATEIGIRKAVGARRTQLFSQFIGESLLVFVIAATAALLMTWLLLPLYNLISGKEISFGFGNRVLWVTLSSSLAFIIVFAGIYPAAWLSSFNALSVLKSRSGTGSAHAFLRKGLVVVQFLIATSLIIAAIVIQRQLTFIHNRDMGYDRENILVVDLQGRAMNLRARELKEELKRTTSVRSATITNQEIINMENFTSSINWAGKSENSKIYMRALRVDEDFLETLGITLLKGRDFRGGEADSASYLLNETAAAYLGSDPVDAMFRLWGRLGTVTGVVKDFNVASVRTVQQPVILLRGNGRGDKLYIRLQAGNLSAHIDRVAQVWNQYYPGYEFNYSFLDNNVDRLYQSEQRAGRLFKGFATIAIFISVLGLWGLTKFTIEQRKKEIGIRKVIGASTATITVLLSKDFLKLVLSGIVLAIPLAWYAMSHWLENFAYSAALSWWIFLLAGFLAVLVALLTISFQSVKAALVNPVTSLRPE